MTDATNREKSRRRHTQQQDNQHGNDRRGEHNNEALWAVTMPRTPDKCRYHRLVLSNYSSRYDTDDINNNQHDKKHLVTAHRSGDKAQGIPYMAIAAMIPCCHSHHHHLHVVWKTNDTIPNTTSTEAVKAITHAPPPCLR